MDLAAELEPRGAARSGDDLFEVPGEKAAAALWERAGVGGGFAAVFKR